MEHQFLSISEQCRILGIHRSGMYYSAKPDSSLNLRLMSIIDKEFFDEPFYGVQKMTHHLRYHVNQKRMRGLYRLMDLRVIYAKKNTSKANKGHKKYPYLLRDLKIKRPNQVWVCDIIWIPMQRDFMYLIAIIDLHNRYIVNWSISTSMDAEWCTEVLEEAIRMHGTPEIFNTDQGSQFTATEFSEYVSLMNLM